MSSETRRPTEDIEQTIKEIEVPEPDEANSTELDKISGGAGPIAGGAGLGRD